jgi:hypothetical protein
MMQKCSSIFSIYLANSIQIMALEKNGSTSGDNTPGPGLIHKPKTELNVTLIIVGLPKV